MELENRKGFTDHEIILDKDESISKSFVANVFSWMVLGLAISGVLAYYFAHSDMINLIVKAEGGLSILGWIVTLAPLGFIIAMNVGMQKWSPTALIILFIGFAAVFGVGLSTIFLAYSSASIAKVFGITAATFAIMAVFGYTTKTDLTKFGSILMMALIGIIIAMVVNFFLASPMMDYIISCLGVLIFTGLVAYDTQKIKRIGAGVEHGSATAMKLTILGATSLYLDFVNLFLFLLRILGGRD